MWCLSCLSCSDSKTLWCPFITALQRAGCSLPFARSSWAGGEVVGSCCPLPGIPSMVCSTATDLKSTQGMIYWLQQRKRGHTEDFLSSSAVYVAPGTLVPRFFPASGEEGGLPSSPQDALGSFRLVWKAGDHWRNKAGQNSH